MYITYNNIIYIYRYKKDPGGGYEQGDIGDISGLTNEAEIRAAKNRSYKSY
jgi:hypothetical protein